MSLRARTTWIGRILLVVTLLALLNRSASATGDIPADLQARLFKKIFAYDKTLSTAREVKVLIVASAAEEEASRELVRAFAGVGVTATTARADEVEAQADGNTVLYVTSSVSLTALKKVCAQKHMLSVSGDSKHAVAGDVTVGLGKKSDGRPEIVINKSRAKTEGHEFFADLLRIAELVE